MPVEGAAGPQARGRTLERYSAVEEGFDTRKRKEEAGRNGQYQLLDFNKSSSALHILEQFSSTFGWVDLTQKLSDIIRHFVLYCQLQLLLLLKRTWQESCV